MPKELDKEKPELKHSLLFVWNSFWELNTERHELGSIPWSSIDRYCKRYELNTDNEYDDFLLYIREMDNFFISLKSKKMERDRKMNSAKPRRGKQ